MQEKSIELTAINNNNNNMRKLLFSAYLYGKNVGKIKMRKYREKKGLNRE